MKTQQLIKSLLFYSLTGLGISLTLKSDIGVSSFNSFNLSLSNWTNIKIGTITALVNMLFILLYIIITKGKFKKQYILQIVSVYSLGIVINFFTYSVLNNVELQSYYLRLLVFILGVCIAGYGTGMVLNLKILSFPIESVCQTISQKKSWSFVLLRYFIDIICVILSIWISYHFGLKVVVREGTLISLFLLSFIIGKTKQHYESRENRMD